jgi:hypothetical protein
MQEKEPMSTRTGGCQCGATHYEVTGEPKQVLACHCTDCQKQSGSAFGLVMVVEEDAFRLIEGEVKTFVSTSDAGREKTGAFCPKCGSRIYHLIAWRPGMLSVRAGTLDETGWLQPTVHLWTRSKQPWISIPDGATVFETQPG